MTGALTLAPSSKPPLRAYPHFKTHHLANELVKAVRLELRDSGNLAAAYENLQNAYDIAIVIIKNVYVDQQGSAIPAESRLKQQGTPLGVAEELVEILHYDKIQQEHPLKYQVAKTLRIFLDLTFLIGKNSDLKINADTHKTIVQNIIDALETLPSGEIQTRYELRCCLAVALLLNDNFIETKAFVLRHVESVVKAVATKSPGELAKPMLELVTNVYRLVDTSWWTFVFPCHLTSRVVFSFEQQHAQNAFKMRTITQAGKDVPDSVVNQYAQMHKDHLSQYKNSRESAFCVLEDLAEMMEKTIIAGGNPSLPIQVLEGDGPVPGVREFMVLETPEISEFLKLKANPTQAFDKVRGKTYWKVQYRAIEVLFNVATHMLAQDAVWQKAITILINRPTLPRTNKKVEQLYQLRLQVLKHNLALPERSEFTVGAAWDAKYKDERRKKKEYNEEINRRAQFIREVVAGKKSELEDATKAKEKTRVGFSEKAQSVKDLKVKIYGPHQQAAVAGEKTKEELVEELTTKTYEVKMDEEELALLETKDALLKF